MEYQIDSLDRKILGLLRADSRLPYLEIARELGVSGGTIHQRMAKLKEHGVVKGHASPSTTGHWATTCRPWWESAWRGRAAAGKS